MKSPRYLFMKRHLFWKIKNSDYKPKTSHSWFWPVLFLIIVMAWRLQATPLEAQNLQTGQ